MSLFNNRLNCYYRTNRAFTEDHIVVKKIFLGSVPIELEPEDVQAYFEIYGNVVGLKLNDKSACGKFKSGYVLFKHAEDASNVLAKDNHFLNRSRLEVKAYHSWGQPDARKVKPLDSTAHIMRLNDDCLELIYHYLPLPDQLNLALLCLRCPPIYRSINLGTFRGLSLWQTRDFLKLFGADLRQVVGQGNYVQGLCEFIGAYCSNLRTLRISDCALSVRLMHKVFKRLTELEEVQLTNCSLSDECLTALTKLHKLKKLNLCYNEKLTGQLMELLPSSLESLNILYCFDVNFELMPEICKALSNLKDLSVKVVYAQTDVFRQLVEHKSCNFLESLTIWSNSSFVNQLHMEYLAKLPSLSKLILHHSPPSTRLLEWLAKHKSQQLSHFEIDSRVSLNFEQLLLISQLSSLRFLALPYNNEIKDDIMRQLHGLQDLRQINLQRCRGVTENAVLALFLACPKLHVLHLECCKLVTNKLIQHIINILNKELSNQRCDRELPIKVYFFGNKFDKLSLEYAAEKHILQVINNFSSNW